MPGTNKPRRFTQEEVEAIVRQAYRDAGSALPSAANRRRMIEQMQQGEMDRKMKAAAAKAGIPMKKKRGS
tara:strand:+ start:251 stop:460 length:210 start_codon:yes stop_codon:yes gene_type:complete